MYCTDTAIGTTAVINEALLFSMEGGMELLPALPEDWKKGCVTGLMARTQAELLCLEWDLEEKVVSAKIRSDREQTLRIRMGLDWRTVVLNEDAAKSADDGRDILVPMEAGSIHKLLFML